MNILIDDIPQLIKQTAKPFDPNNRVLVRELEYINATHATSTVSKRGIDGWLSRNYRYSLEAVSRMSGVQHCDDSLVFATPGRLKLEDVVFDATGQVKKLLHRAGDKKGEEVVRAHTNDHLHTLSEQCIAGITQGAIDLETLYWQIVENNILVQVAHFEQKEMDTRGMAKKSPDTTVFGSRLKAIGITHLEVLRPKLRGLWFIC